AESALPSRSPKQTRRKGSTPPLRPPPSCPKTPAAWSSSTPSHTTPKASSVTLRVKDLLLLLDVRFAFLRLVTPPDASESPPTRAAVPNPQNSSPPPHPFQATAPCSSVSPLSLCSGANSPHLESPFAVP